MGRVGQLSSFAGSGKALTWGLLGLVSPLRGPVDSQSTQRIRLMGSSELELPRLKNEALSQRCLYLISSLWSNPPSSGS